jgi:hypothetical protein
MAKHHPAHVGLCDSSAQIAAIRRGLGEWADTTRSRNRSEELALTIRSVTVVAEFAIASEFRRRGIRFDVRRDRRSIDKLGG